MAISKRYSVSGDPFADGTMSGFGAQPLYQPLREEVWPIWRAVWFWIELSAVGWTAFVGLVLYFFSVWS